MLVARWHLQLPELREASRTMGIAFKERFILKRLLKVRGSVVWNHVTFWCFVTWGSTQGSWGCFSRIWYISSKLRLNLPLGLLVSP